MQPSLCCLFQLQVKGRRGVVLLLLVILTPSSLLALGGSSEGGQQPNPIASLLPFALMGLVVWLIARRTKRKKSMLADADRQHPPTPRQMDFINNLMEEREVETWMLEKEPTTIQEASELIDKLKKLPIRQGDF